MSDFGMEQEKAGGNEVGGARLVPAFDGVSFSIEWKDALWEKFCTAAPQRQRQSVEQYKIVKRA
jgi:hypothetical protein